MLNQIDPLTDARWAALIDDHASASIFHTRGWLDALRRTYGYRPLAFTTAPPDQPLRDAIVFCDVRSWLTGRRLVSLPFSDHCDPLIETRLLAAACKALDDERRRGRWRYVELRPRTPAMRRALPFDACGDYCFHILDLRPAEEKLFASFHRTATQQMIRRAERERLVCEEGHSEALLRAFHSLVALTRRRHRLPPQPFAWFQHLATTLGDAMTVRIASLGDSPIAGIVTLRHRQTMTFKYGASDARFHRLGGVQLLLWRAIQHAKALGCETMDFGRSDRAHTSLAVFKDRWGAVRSELAYWRSPPSRPRPVWVMRSAEQALRLVPAPLLSTAGRLLYRHVA